MAGAATGSRSAALVEGAEGLFPGGVVVDIAPPVSVPDICAVAAFNSPIRAFRAGTRRPPSSRRSPPPRAAGFALGATHPFETAALEESAAAPSRLTEAVARAGQDVAVARVGSSLTVFFGPTPPADAARTAFAA